MEELERFKRAVEYLKTKAKKPTNEAVSELLRYKTLSYISDVIGGSKPISPLLLDRMVEYSINKDWVTTGKGQMLLEKNASDNIIVSDNTIILIEFKTAAGKTIQIKPEGASSSEIELLNALLEERDRAFDERNRIIEKIETQSDARINELKKDKEDLNNKLNSILEKIYTSQQIALGYQKAWVDYEAEKVAKGDQKKKKEIVYKMGKLVDDMIENDASKGIPAEIGKSGRGEK
jgi:hypothetical protein